MINIEIHLTLTKSSGGNIELKLEIH